MVGVCGGGVVDETDVKPRKERSTLRGGGPPHAALMTCEGVESGRGVGTQRAEEEVGRGKSKHKEEGRQPWGEWRRGSSALSRMRRPKTLYAAQRRGREQAHKTEQGEDSGGGGAVGDGEVVRVALGRGGACT